MSLKSTVKKALKAAGLSGATKRGKKSKASYGGKRRKVRKSASKKRRKNVRKLGVLSDMFK